ncbi:hypothetical protein Sros_6356 [Streptosporangium roseum DSM 43021]|uniref:Uncharacterized protein n=1 Tax=Streptosporangium roseum (strain ATCC 12428 / DSM 43021 / JCM 3005 / KCTC 9067 / NCIMB 10171 / NRRL 2505 / NI 9100) TaxID=479432 RepID=D2B071_STRRD|nr:hypothetical protein Sros_6356 [Streptosporangium roseum DSM 43021]
MEERLEPLRLTRLPGPGSTPVPGAGAAKDVERSRPW